MKIFTLIIASLISTSLWAAPCQMSNNPSYQNAPQHQSTPPQNRNQYRAQPNRQYNRNNRQPNQSRRRSLDNMNFNDPKKRMSNMWKDGWNEPSNWGPMPGGWNLPSMSMPNPVNSADDFSRGMSDLPKGFNQ